MWCHIADAKNHKEYSPEWSEFRLVHRRHHDNNKGYETCRSIENEEEIPSLVSWFTCKRIHDERVYTSHDKKADTAKVKSVQDTSYNWAVDLVEMENCGAAKAETRGSKEHYHGPSWHVRKYKFRGEC